DCLEATVAASLFGVYAAAMEKLQDTSDRRATFFPAFVLACILLKLSQILNMFISREREYRADAASVRMTRNPLALAEALHLLSRNWRGMGFIGNGLEMLCIVNPQAKELDESEGFWADLMSTHPPIKKRIEILLRMAHASMAELDRKPKMPDTVKATEPFYYAIDPKQQWQGPYALSELASLPWFSPLTWISSAAGVGRAWENPLFETIFSDRLSRSEDEVTDLSCPSCKQPLIERSYENTQIFQCKFCSGILVENDRIPRIIARKETPCTDRVKSLAKAVISQNRINLTKQISKAGDRKNIPHTVCPKCKDPMTRLFYSLAYLIEIDRCSMCSMTWFDAEELEMLRCLIENKITAVDIPQ
ncbi:MAG: zf-TFIIB domain-containing protein, partial [Nitrospirae bacterium]|nr:zf-TFIIB domain-containing protein [Nitrospirota bacterium]